MSYAGLGFTSTASGWFGEVSDLGHRTLHNSRCVREHPNAARLSMGFRMSQ
jgi:hypothetical protein